jgi:superfamily II DNA or RNA helicase
MLTFEYGNVFTEVNGDYVELGTVRQILTFDEENPSLLFENRFYSGLLDHVTSLLDSMEFEYEVTGKPEPPEVSLTAIPSDLLSGITLRDYQKSTLEKAFYNRRGIIHLPCGSGKTVLSAAISNTCNGRSLLVVPGVSSMRQTRARYMSYGITDVGILGDEDSELNHQHVIAVINSLYRGILKKNKDILSLLDEIECIMFMEAHHVPSKMWATVGGSCNSDLRFALTATPYFKYDNPTTFRDFLLVGLTGKVVSRIPDYLLMNKGHLATPKIHFLDIYNPKVGGNNWQILKNKCINGNAYRNNCISNIATSLINKNLNVMTLVNEISHGRVLCELMSSTGVPTYFYRGESNLITFEDGEEKDSSVVPIDDFLNMLAALPVYNVVGSPSIHEDSDFPSVDVLLVASAGRAYKRVIQRAGRVLRSKTGLNIAHIIDFSDYTSFILQNQSNERRDFYRSRYSKADNYEYFEYRKVDELINKVIEYYV